MEYRASSGFVEISVHGKRLTSVCTMKTLGDD